MTTNGRITFATLYTTLIILDHIIVTTAVVVSFVLRNLRFRGP